jgi:FKBP-type peptidyl-prolyl cis-trans isomerase
LKGTGIKATAGRKVTIHYTGKFIDGQIFDSSYERNKPFTFTLGALEVIPGLEEGVSLMQVGGKARLIIPSFLAYGEKQIGPIPPFSTLIFEIELLSVE